MRVVVLCPFSAGTVLWQATSGAWTLSVCVRGTFSLVNGREAVLADPQEPVAGDRHVADDPRQRLYAPSDLVPYKPRVDVVLVGSAYAPHHEPVEALVARITLGGLDKALGVIGDRAWIEGPDGPEPSAPRPFGVMQLGDERAARDRDNPLGFDLTRPPTLGAPALPNLEAADDEIGVGRTVGFGPVLPSAASRRGMLRPDGWAWVEGGGRGPAPPGFDFAFYNAAPRDQQIDVVRGGDALLLENLSREHPHLETRLPTVRPKAFLVPSDVERGIEIPLRCDTVWIDTDRALLTLSWRGLCTVDTPDEEALGTVVIAAESRGRDVGYAQIARILRDGPMSTTDGDTFTDSRPPAPRRESSGDLDPDLIPTPAPFKPKRILPDIASAARSPDAPPVAPAPAPQPEAPVDRPAPAPPEPELDAPTTSRPALASGVELDAPTTSRPALASGVELDAPTTSRPALASVPDLEAPDLEAPTASRPAPTSVTAVDPPTVSGPSPAKRGAAGASAKLPAPVPPPLVIEAEETAAPLSWEELTQSDLVEAGIGDDPQTLTRLDGRRRDEAAFDEPSTRPLLQRPARPAELLVGDYARIAVAVERGDPASALFAVGLALPDLPGLQRAWSERSAADPAFAQAFTQAVAAARRG